MLKYTYNFRRPTDDEFEIEASCREEADSVFSSYLIENNWPENLVEIDNVEESSIVRGNVPFPSK